MRTATRHVGAPGTLLCAGLLVVGLGCSKAPPDATGSDPEVTEVRRLPLDTLAAIRTRSGVELDRAVTSDGKGSLRVTVKVPTVVHLYELGKMDIDGARLIYRAKVRTFNVDGKAYLEMWCHLPGKGAVPSRGLATAIGGTTEWTVQEVAVALEKGQRPENVRLNVVVAGAGTVWIDDIRLLRAPLQ